jgi:hypothetical protein
MTILFLCTSITSYFGESFTIISVTILFLLCIFLAVTLYIIGEARLMQEPMIMSGKLDSALTASSSQAIKALFKM